eukprot:gene5586-11261_t
MSAAQPPADDKAKSERNFVADQQNWEQRVKSELESATKWNDNWGELFKGDVPHDYEGRIKHLEEQLKSKDSKRFVQTILEAETANPEKVCSDLEYYAVHTPYEKQLNTTLEVAMAPNQGMQNKSIQDKIDLNEFDGVTTCLGGKYRLNTGTSNKSRGYDYFKGILIFSESPKSRSESQNAGLIFFSSYCDLSLARVMVPGTRYLSCRHSTSVRCPGKPYILILHPIDGPNFSLIIPQAPSSTYINPRHPLKVLESSLNLKSIKAPTYYSAYVFDNATHNHPGRS